MMNSKIVSLGLNLWAYLEKKIKKYCVIEAFYGKTSNTILFLFVYLLILVCVQKTKNNLGIFPLKRGDNFLCSFSFQNTDPQLLVDSLSLSVSLPHSKIFNIRWQLDSGFVAFFAISCVIILKQIQATFPGPSLRMYDIRIVLAE